MAWKAIQCYSSPRPVLSAIPIFMLTPFRLGKWAFKLEKIHRDFLWKSNNNTGKGVCLVTWKMVCHTKSLGELGILDLRWKWCECQDHNRHWIITQVPCDKMDSSLFDVCTNVTIWRGDIAKFWSSRWLDDTAPAELAPNLYKLTRLNLLALQCILQIRSQVCIPHPIPRVSLIHRLLKALGKQSAAQMKVLHVAFG